MWEVREIERKEAGESAGLPGLLCMGIMDVGFQQDEKVWKTRTS